MENPFEYGGIVGASAFCNRKQELADLTRTIINANNLFLFGERGFGKTSLVMQAATQLPVKDFISIYVDLWPTQSDGSFITSYAKATVEAFSTTPGKMFDTVKNLFGRLQPVLGLDEEGKPQITFSPGRKELLSDSLDSVLEAPAKIAAKTNKRVVVVFDEFQQILEYENDFLERKLRSIIQMHQNVAYIFLGSRKHLIHKMFIDKSRPLYRFAGHYPIGPIAEEHWIPFITSNFTNANKAISKKHIHTIYSLTEGHPAYTQHLCHALWEQTPEENCVTETLIHDALETVLKRENYAYINLWDSLTINQKIFLEALSNEQFTFHPFSADFIERSGMKTSSNVQRAVEALLSKDIIDRNNGSSFIISDRFLALWIQKMSRKKGFFVG